MDPLARQWALPAGYAAGGAMITLEQAMSADTVPLGAEALALEQRVALVRARWVAGEWSDVLICDEAVDLARALAEVEAQTPIGRELLRTAERALEMVFEAARAS